MALSTIIPLLPFIVFLPAIIVYFVLGKKETDPQKKEIKLSYSFFFCFGFAIYTLIYTLSLSIPAAYIVTIVFVGGLNLIRRLAFKEKTMKPVFFALGPIFFTLCYGVFLALMFKIADLTPLTVSINVLMLVFVLVFGILNFVFILKRKKNSKVKQASTTLNGKPVNDTLTNSNIVEEVEESDDVYEEDEDVNYKRVKSNKPIIVQKQKIQVEEEAFVYDFSKPATKVEQTSAEEKSDTEETAL